jgi:hypothetical protein
MCVSGERLHAPPTSCVRVAGIRVEDAKGMSTSAIGSNSSQGLDALIQQFVERVDSNKDGQISKNEFATFLTSLLSDLSSNADSSKGTTGTGKGLTAGDSTPATTDAVEAPPSTWTDCNGYNGYTFAGFSPQDHTELTPATLGDFGNEKYAAFSWLVANKIDPRTDWAPAAAEALNKKYNTNAFQAVRPQKLQWRGEYIRSSENGFGMRPGQFNENAVGQFFWCTEY